MHRRATEILTSISMSEASNFAPAEHPDPGAKFNTEVGHGYTRGYRKLNPYPYPPKPYPARVGYKTRAGKPAGGKLFKAGNYGGAAKYYQCAIAENDTVSTYFANLAEADLRLEMYHAAQDAAQRALTLDPRSVKARYRRAMARKGLNLIPEALVDIAVYGW
ncbi:hypothetical protein DFH08DRAFT_1073180 [Mycena albidolilacea]|uniref:Uncharacterized protein n=1 Tax=Mycena albidolilacea TaxID=1033008 RepID=A0AAD7AP93_9AGAR|nr:hypothetical protein DFH08DRAFT_1073180 [Mycena albidolilacea]